MERDADRRWKGRRHVAAAWVSPLTAVGISAALLFWFTTHHGRVGERPTAVLLLYLALALASALGGLAGLIGLLGVRSRRDALAIIPGALLGICVGGCNAVVSAGLRGRGKEAVRVVGSPSSPRVAQPNPRRSGPARSALTRNTDQANTKFGHRGGVPRGSLSALRGDAADGCGRFLPRVPCGPRRAAGAPDGRWRSCRRRGSGVRPARRMAEGGDRAGGGCRRAVGVHPIGRGRRGAGI